MPLPGTGTGRPEAPLTTRAIACGDAMPGASPDAMPHSSAAAYVAGARHLTQADALHDALPEGSAAASALPAGGAVIK